MRNMKKEVIKNVMKDDAGITMPKERKQSRNDTHIHIKILT